MRQRTKREIMPNELAMAIGLVWGHLKSGQFEHAHRLARGCMRVWPGETRLVLMAAYAAVELFEPLDDDTLSALKASDCPDWAGLVLRRAQHTASAATVSENS